MRSRAVSRLGVEATATVRIALLRCLGRGAGGGGISRRGLVAKGVSAVGARVVMGTPCLVRLEWTKRVCGDCAAESQWEDDDFLWISSVQ